MDAFLRTTLTILAILLSHFSLAQSSRNELANSKIYVRATYFNEDNKLIGIQTRTDFGDTLIDNIIYRKFQTFDFVDYAAQKDTRIFYECFANDIYCLLDKNKKIVHKINYRNNKEQVATIFGKQSNIVLEFIDPKKDNEMDSFIPTEKTPRKYYLKDSSDIYLIIIPDLKTLVVSNNGKFYTKQLLGDNYLGISNGMEHNNIASTKFDIAKGDEIQLFYRRKWYNTSNKAEYEDKQFKNFKYISDTIINNCKTLILEVDGYSFLSGNYDHPEKTFITLTDSGYYIDKYRFIQYKDYKTELKLVEKNKKMGIFLQGVSYDTIEGNTYSKIIIDNSDPYRYFILPFFPVPYIEFGNVQGVITYSKIKGIEKGKKRERTFITHETNIRDIISKSKREVEIIMYFVNDADVEIKINDYETNKIVGRLKTKVKIGLNSLLVDSRKFESNKQYSVEIDYHDKTGGGGSFSRSVIINF